MNFHLETNDGGEKELQTRDTSQTASVLAGRREKILSGEKKRRYRRRIFLKTAKENAPPKRSKRVPPPPAGSRSGPFWEKGPLKRVASKEILESLKDDFRN